MAKDSTTRGLRDEATVGPDPTSARDLRRLSELRYEVADGEPDIRGWHVYSSTGRELGVVTDLLVDTAVGEVVMLDVDLRRNDQHTFAPVRAAWIDHATKRVVLDARALDDASVAGTGATSTASVPALSAVDATPTTTREPVASPSSQPLPALPRSGRLSDDDIRRFNDEYVRAYGTRAAESEVAYRVPRGADETLAFERSTPRRLFDPSEATTTAAATPAAAGGREMPAGEPRPAFEESRAVNQIMSAPAVDGAQAADRPADVERRVERRVERTDDASQLDAAAAIDPRELDARVRIDEGATVDDAGPVAGVRYDAEPYVEHRYGTPDEAYGPGHGDGRIGFDRVVTRGPAPSADRDAAQDDVRPLRYRDAADRYRGPADAR